jgi:hypothetical protein
MLDELFWRGEVLDSPLAFDTETDARGDLKRQVPRLALASACDGERLVLLRPAQLEAFISLHERHDWVGHNLAAFDFWVVEEFLKRGLELEDHWAWEAWWRIADSGRLHDTMLLDLLVRIALGRGESGQAESKLFPKNLAQLAREYAPHVPEPDKSSEFRLRYHELLESADWSSLEPGFFTYPLDDARATWWAWRVLVEKAQGLAQKTPPGRAYPDAQARFGLLTERLQVQGAIALSQATRNGLAVDQPLLAEKEAVVRAGVEDSLQWLILNHRELFEFKKKTGRMVMQPKAGLPKMKALVLKTLLTAAAQTQGREPLRSKGKTGAISVSVKDWRASGLTSPFIGHWLTVADSKTTLGLFAAARGCESRVHPSYRTLVSTGRVSCYDPNLQQFPKGSGFRDAFIASPGHLLYVCDYAAIELRTLAAICLARFGRSVLSEIFQRPAPHNDPHAYTASLVLGVPFEEFLTWKKSPDSHKQAEFKRTRQAAKAVNFGTPGGLGGPKLVDYAKSQYAVSLTLDEARAFREKLITEIYPEIGLYLKDSTLDALALNLGLDPVFVHQIVGDLCSAPGAFEASLPKILKGTPIKADGTPYKTRWVEQCWSILNGLVRAAGSKPELLEACRLREGSFDTCDLFLAEPAVTPTGRLRGGVRYTQKLNTPFQGLAADGAKLALWRATQQGLRVAGFVHDELIFEFPCEQAEQRALQAKRLLEESMSEVLNHAVPVEAEGHLTPRWTK